MDSKSNDKESANNQPSQSDMKNGSGHSDLSQNETSSSVPTLVLLWIWNWFATLPKAITNLFTDIKSGEFLSRFTLLDAMLQFIFAVATSCHPQEDPDVEEIKANSDKPKDIKAFEGPGRELRSRTAAANS